MRRLATLDGLTSIANRRRFDQFLSYEWERSTRYDHPLSLLLMDIDFFKPYNDHYGHSEGDECLKKVAKAIERAVPRAVDLVARYGGEEFACILPETSSEGAQATARRILQVVSSLKIPHAHSKAADHVTVSIGVATADPACDNCDLDLVELADKALYQAKDAGRNQLAFLIYRERT